MTKTQVASGTDRHHVAAILTRHAPEWAALPVRAIESLGTDNVMFRLGERWVLRFARHAPTVPFLEKEMDWLPRLGGLPLLTPTLQVRGSTDTGMPFGIFSWLDGEIATSSHIADPYGAAGDLARFLIALHKIATNDAPAAGVINNRRGVALRDLNDVTLTAIDTLQDELDTTRARSMWDAACRATNHSPPVWLHGDLKADNLIAHEGCLSGVIDWGLSAVGDPAVDYAAAWTWVAPEARNQFRTQLELGKSDWRRASGWALYMAAIALSYYRGRKNDALCKQARQTLSQLHLLR
ncbi:phosphotransferase [Tritonibacter mobilis]|uniref:phosphotransferase n=1 Tax=Tritonibacter mobilis TaxID=379347 RepID=UPI001403C962|nr:phosphotransferase [Tritonibacter mobilis]NHM20111.1 phosphotransferase [Tritonibacter mobilis]NHM24275.1 phosphotransferase [Tritonibacter mobilis]